MKRWMMMASAMLLTLPAAAQNRATIESRDHYTNVVSTAPSQAGQTVRLYLRERVKGTPDPNKIVLFIHGAGTPAEVSFDVPYADYSWMAYLADAGYDVFAVDMEGYGRSARPAAMSEKCNLNEAQRTLYKVAADCKPTMTSGVTTLASDWNDVGAAVDYVLNLRHASKLNLFGWSQGGPRSAGWAAQHPDKVAKLVLLAPAYNNGAGRGAGGAGRAAAPATANGAPPRGSAFNVQTHEDLVALWNRQAPCPGQYTPETLASVWKEMLASDSVGSTWDPPARRAPVTAPSPGASWTPEMARNTKIPTLMVSGEHDGQVNPQNVRNLYGDIGGDKVFVDLACSSHNAMWEKNHLLLFAASREWLDKGTVNGQKNVMLKLGY
ncbi:MAG: alpha/beta fold hydrolase [Alphaproteobacteria bacterium]|nr:alpha/beta fold hydrolase [Alphaproteobacteria bacterium]